jgi:RNA polymerase sigma-70 factor, ECF subfamily
MKELDALTVQRAKKGDGTSFRALYDFYAPFSWKIAYRTLHGDSGAAQEAVQETFIRVYKSLKRFGGESALSTWIYRITFNACMTLLSKRNRVNETQELDENTGSPVPSAERIDMKEDIQKILKSISAEERFLLTGREMLGFSFEELADITGKSAGSLRTQLFRLKEELRKKFGDF